MEKEWQCVCAGQGGSVYSAMCPIHDPNLEVIDHMVANLEKRREKADAK